ncbi:hypothetical protein [Brevibacterium litoralis]|uniref:hypothetical protein n=1 Tax=Brevibacterium litoralis TaxID=3138935 RepID=UPI0032ECD829
MHVAVDVREEQFRCARAGASIGWREVFPGWGRHDRFGIVVREPYGSLGASLLMQLACLAFYDTHPARRGESTPQYPQVYVFHVGGPWGDHSSYDVWPATHEVFLGEDPYELLCAINDRAITRLAVPEWRVRKDDTFTPEAMSRWSARHRALEAIPDVHVYAPDGVVEGADLVLSSDAEELERMFDWSMDLEGTAHHFGEEISDDGILALGLGPSVPQDIRNWAGHLGAKANEVPLQMRLHLAVLRRKTLREGVRHQGFRTVPTARGLLML